VALGLAADALTAGLMVAGDGDGDEFQEWRLSRSDTLARLATAWIHSSGQTADVERKERLALTDAGREQAEDILRQEAEASQQL